MNDSLYLRHRPATFGEMLGQDGTIQKIEKMIEKGTLPRAMLAHGSTGCGKTTLWRALAKRLKVTKKSGNLMEMNSSQYNGVDDIRSLTRRVRLRPTIGKYRIWIMDEVHQITRNAQDAFLKLLEDTPPHVIFLLATTDPAKLIKPLRNRLTEFQLKPLDNSDMASLLSDVCKKEKFSLKKDVKNKLIEVAAGSPRKALVMLHSVLHCDTEADQLETIVESEAEKQAIDIARALMKNTIDWKEIAGLLRSVTEEPESIRRMVLAYANNVALNGGGRGFVLIDCFSSNYFDIGKAGLTWSCKQVELATRPAKR